MYLLYPILFRRVKIEGEYACRRQDSDHEHERKMGGYQTRYPSDSDAVCWTLTARWRKINSPFARIIPSSMADKEVPSFWAGGTMTGTIGLLFRHTLSALSCWWWQGPAQEFRSNKTFPIQTPLLFILIVAGTRMITTHTVCRSAESMYMLRSTCVSTDISTVRS
jgi:hypothetical protein